MITTRRLGESDWELFRDLQLACLLDAPWAARVTYDQAARRSQTQWRHKLIELTMYAAFRDDVPIGTAGAWVAQSEPPELVSMWVTPGERGRGAADLLVRAVLDWARESGFALVALWVLEDSVRAQKVYQRHGFAMTGRRMTREQDDRFDVEMTLDLANHQAAHT
ncbi:GNAT family N-acetyltransferase [Nocardia panacis]|uniref:GNAT family N-acetyltransferase n=1 Tax=Nocardia panacis TaxID=2340916 RepID=A0A3A4KZ04_9NOCA|nr:GNAT family N-acetyltransferase [Nocardia panacis]RJO74757.1 GNAT family N-acetyltransferase [Nocardia panacis]